MLMSSTFEVAMITEVFLSGSVPLGVVVNFWEHSFPA